MQTQASPHPRGLAPLIAALTAVGPFSVDTYLPSMKQIGVSLNATMPQVQMTLTSYMVTFSVMTLWHGAISDAVGRRRVILWSTALYVLATIVCAFAPTIETLILFRGVQGMTAGAGMVVGRAVVRDLFEGPSAQRLMANVTLVFALAPAIAPIIGGWLQVSFGWRSIFVFLIAFGCLAWALCLRLLPESLPVERRQSLRPRYLLKAYSAVLLSPAFLAVCLGMTLNFAGLFIYIVGAPRFIMEHLRLTETGFIWIFGPLTIGMAAGSWCSSRAAGKMSLRMMLTIGYGTMLIASLASLAMSHWMLPRVPWAVLPLMGYAFGMSFLFPPLTLLALDLFPAQRGLAASCQSFVQTAGAAVVSIVVAYLWATTETLAMSQLAFLVAGLLATLSHFLLRQTTREPIPQKIVELPSIEGE